jgi:peptidyl-tRNA hydrolase
MSSIVCGDKLYCVVRADLKPGEQTAQLGHAVAQFCLDHHDAAKEWHKQSNYICVLHIEDEPSLYHLQMQLTKDRIPHSAFHEPDYDDAMTALVFHPTGKHLVRHLPLAFAENQPSSP